MDPQQAIISGEKGLYGVFEGGRTESRKEKRGGGRARRLVRRIVTGVWCKATTCGSGRNTGEIKPNTVNS